MDQDDRQYGDTNEGDSYSPQNQEDSATTNPSVNGTDSRHASMTHVAPSLGMPSRDIEPPKIENNRPVEPAMIGPEIEPATVAYAVKEQTSGERYEGTAEDNIQPKEYSATSPIQQKTSTAGDKKRGMIMAAAGLLLLVVIGVVAWWIFFGGKAANSGQSDTISAATTEQPILGIKLSIADGTVEFSSDSATWQSATTATELKQGDAIRTGANSRAVVAFDDGSALRLDADTEVKFESLATNNIVVRQVAGSAYSRVVPSDRIYTIAIDDDTYKALGTAFLTTKKENESGVQVYQSSVEVSSSTEKVPEGKQYFIKSDDSNLQGKISNLNIDTLADNIFIGWNIDQDENDPSFKDNLGMLSQIKQRIVEKAADQAKENNDTTEAEEERVTRGAMTLGLSGTTFNWSYTGKAVHGFKLVYSKQNTIPTLDKDSAVYIEDPSTLTASLPSKETIGAGKYYVRVCAYATSGDKDSCVDYSNVIIITL